MSRHPTNLALVVDDLTSAASGRNPVHSHAHFFSISNCGFNVLYPGGSAIFENGTNAILAKSGSYNIGNSWGRYAPVLEALIDAAP